MTSVPHRQILFLLKFKSSLSSMVSNAPLTHDVHRRSSSPAVGPADPTGYISSYGYQGLGFCSSATAKSQTPILEFPSITCSQISATQEGSYASGPGREACIHELKSIISSIVRMLLSSGYHGRVIPVIGYVQSNCWPCHYALVPSFYCEVNFLSGNRMSLYLYTHT